MMLPDLSDYRVLIVPGLNDSGPGHWQTRWQAHYPAFERVEQDRWDRPDLLSWSQRLTEKLQQSTQPVIIVAHSFGCLASVHATWRFPHVVAALLVAPADPEKFGFAHLLHDARMRCPTIMMGSENDPWMVAHRAAYWADCWGCGFVNAGALGHINAESALGDWEQGLQQLGRLRAVADVCLPSSRASC